MGGQIKISSKVIGKTVMVMSWYDNEWGYSNRMLDLIKHMDSRKLFQPKLKSLFASMRVLLASLEAHSTS